MMKTFLYVLDKQTEREQFWWSAEKCSKGVRPSWGRTESP